MPGNPLNQQPIQARPVAPLILESYTPEPRISHKKHPILLSVLALAGVFALGRYTACDSEEKIRQEKERVEDVQRRQEARQCILDLLSRTSRSSVTPSRDLLNGELSRCESIVLAKPEKKTE